MVGLDPDVSEAITDVVVAWMADGPRRDDERVVASLTFYEAPVADRFLLGYMVDDEVPRSGSAVVAMQGRASGATGPP